MQENNINDKLFDAMLKIAAEEALRQEIDEMPSCEELNAQYKPSPALDKKIRKTISRHNFKEKAARRRKYAARTAACAAIFIIISSTVLLGIEATRNNIFNAIIQWREKYVSIEHSDNADNTQKNIIYRPTYLPEGFEEVSSKVTENYMKIIYENENNKIIIFTQGSAQSANILADNEEKIYTIIKINGRDAYLIDGDQSDKGSTIIWEIDGVVIVINSELKSTELIKIAESVKKYFF